MIGHQSGRALPGILLILLGIGSCLYWMKGKLADIREHAPEAETEGTAFAQTTDELGCPKESSPSFKPTATDCLTIVKKNPLASPRRNRNPLTPVDRNPLKRRSDNDNAI